MNLSDTKINKFLRCKFFTAHKSVPVTSVIKILCRYTTSYRALSRNILLLTYYILASTRPLKLRNYYFTILHYIHFLIII